MQNLMEDEIPGTAAYEARIRSTRTDSDRIDQLHGILQQCDVGISEAIGIGRGWTDLRDALDSI